MLLTNYKFKEFMENDLSLEPENLSTQTQESNKLEKGWQSFLKTRKSFKLGLAAGTGMGLLGYNVLKKSKSTNTMR